MDPENAHHTNPRNCVYILFLRPYCRPLSKSPYLKPKPCAQREEAGTLPGPSNKDASLDVSKIIQSRWGLQCTGMYKRDPHLWKLPCEVLLHKVTRSVKTKARDVAHEQLTETEIHVKYIEVTLRQFSSLCVGAAPMRLPILNLRS